MSKKIVVIDAGHGGNDPGAIGNNMKEAVITLSVSKLVGEELSKHNIDVRYSRSTDKTLSLSERAKMANNLKADLFISDHCNSFSKQSAYGVEVFTHPNSSSTADRLSLNMVNRLAKDLGMRNRGAKEANFQVLRETNMPAILIENGFISNTNDAAILKNKQPQIAKAIADEILKYFGITCNGHAKPPAPTTGTTFYRVVCGSFDEKKYALEREKLLESKGNDAFLDAFVKDGKTFYRVVAGSFTDRVRAEKLEKKIEAQGFDCFLAVYKK